MKVRKYKSMLKMTMDNGRYILGWFPSHYNFGRNSAIEVNKLLDLKKRNKALMILENDEGYAELIEVDGFVNGLTWVDAQTKPLREMIIAEAKKSKFYLEG
jgi:hypothetical protein